MKNLKLSLVAVAMLCTVTTFGAEIEKVVKVDTVKTATEKKDRSKDVLLNANSATDPRIVPIGLPAAYTIVEQDGLPAVYFWDPNPTQVHWRNEFSLAQVSSNTMSETALQQGEVGIAVTSKSMLGGPQFKGRMKYEGNTNGKHLFDVNVSGPLAKNWFYSLSMYQNFDPGSTKLAYTNYRDRAAFYTAQLTHKYNKGQFTFGYKHTDIHLLQNVDQQAPFIWVGDGSIKELDGFKVGQDTYSPISGRATYMDLLTGKMQTLGFNDGAHYKTHEGRFLLDHKLNEGWDLAVKAKVSTNKISQINDATSNILLNQTRYYADDLSGTEVYKGDVQRRMFNLFQGHSTDALFLATLTHKTDHHKWVFGFLDYFNDSENAHSTAQHDHEVKANPRALLFNGNEFFNFNASAEYIDGWENKLGGYVMDTWTPNDIFKITYGARGEWFSLGVNNIPQVRCANFYLGGTNAKGETIALQHWTLPGFNYAVSVIPTIHITKNFGFDGEFNQFTMYRHLQGFYGTGAPAYSNRPHTLGRAGVYWNHPLVSVVSSFVYVYRKNDAGRISVPNPDGSGSVMCNYTQALRTMGWKTDVLFTPGKGFKLNVVFTLQSPKIAAYKFSAFGTDYDYAGKYQTGMSNVLLDITPSWTNGKFNISTTIRYASKKYANLANSVYFNGFWETFAQASYKVNKHLSFTANVVNYLNQRGASGNVPGSALIVDATPYYGTVISGTYIRPFEASFGARINF